MTVAHLDYEGRSGVDITEVGSHRWSIDPRFELFMAGVRRDGDPHVYLWINPKFRTPDLMGENEEAERILEEADIVYAHNAPNELANTWGALEQGKACPVKSWERLLPRLRCTAAMARKAGLPHSLEKLCETLKVRDSKDRAGKALIQFFCIPDPETGQFNEPRDHPEKWAAFAEYCRQDVRAETECGDKLKAFELTGSALATFQFDLRMNQRGVPVNVTAARNAQKIIDKVQGGVADEFRRLTGYNVTQRAKVLAWFNTKLGLNMANTQAATVEATIEDLERQKLVAANSGFDAEFDRADEALRVLTMYQAVSYAAVKKIQTMLDCVCPDGRVRGCHMYYGAGTGRWSSKLLQVQNFRKPDKAMKSFIEPAYLAVCKGIDAEMMEQIYGPPLEVLANCIRNFIHHPEHEILDGDYNAIEGRIACWIAGQEDILEAWRRGEDLYKRAAAFVEGKHESEILNPSPERDFGKVVELACQFGLGVDGFIRTCAKFGIECDEEKAKRSVHEYYRPTHDKIVTRWWQHDTWMRDAIAYPNTKQGPWICKRIAGFNYLLLYLPSGRALAFPDPQIKKRKATRKELVEMLSDHFHEDELTTIVSKHASPGALELWAENKYGAQELENLLVKRFTAKRFMEITYWGQLPMSAAWGRVKMHGSLGFQNEVQAIATDFMAHGAVTAEARGMPPFMLVHDQGVALRNNRQTAEAFAAALADLPSWAKNFPMKVEAKIHPWFRK